MEPAGGTDAGPFQLSAAEYPDTPPYPDEENGWDQADYEAWREDLQARLALGREQSAALGDFLAASARQLLTGAAGENRVYSPLNIYLALAMLAEVTDGESRGQILEVLGAESIEGLREQAGAVWNAAYRDDGVTTTVLASSLWISEDLIYRQETLDALAEHYYAASYQAPMGTDAADQALTDWTAEQTRGLIGSDGKVLETTPDTLMVLASTLYVMGRWNTEFQPENNTDDVFTTADGAEQEAEFMHRTENAYFLSREGYQAASLHSSAGEVVFVLPDEGVSPRELLADPEFLGSLDVYGDDGIYGEVRWSVPKFDVGSDLDLKSTLAGLGITSVLDTKTADFSPLTGTEPVWLDQAKQIARVQVDEQGIVAAAVTLLGLGDGGPEVDPRICVMDLDRPFLFVVRSNNDVNLFVGVVDSLV